MAPVPPTGPERRDPESATQPKFLPKKKRRTARYVVLALVLAAGAASAALTLRPPVVTTAPVIRGAAMQAVYATGVVEAASRVTVRSKIAGSVGDLKVREGQHVMKGDVIAVIDSPALKFDLEQGQAALSAANKQSKSAPRLLAIASKAASTRSDIGIARKERDRLSELVTSGSATPAELERAEARVRSLEAELGSYEAEWSAERIDLTARASGSTAQVESLTARLEDAQVRAPMDGVVLSKLVESGEVVTQNQAIVRIGDTSNLLLESSVDESDINRIAVGSPAAVSLYAFSGQALRATVREILPDADRARKSFIAKIKLDNPPNGLRTGMTGEVNIIVEERSNTLLAPTESVDAAGLAWLVHDGRAMHVPVRLGIRDMLQVEVLSGLVEGDQVVVSGADGLVDNGRVTATVRVHAPAASSAGAPSASPAASPSAAPAGASATAPPSVATPAPSTPAPTTPEKAQAAPSFASPASTLVFADAPAKPKEDPIPSKIGIIVPPTSSRGQAILVDNLWAGRSGKPIRWECGPHNVMIGKGAAPRRVVVPCGGTVALEETP